MYAIQLIMDILSVVPAVDSELELKISLSLFLWKIIRVLQNLWTSKQVERPRLPSNGVVGRLMIAEETQQGCIDTYSWHFKVKQISGNSL